MTKTVRIFKIIDPVLQSVLFVLLAYSFDYTNYYRFFLPAIIGWQLVSSILHFFIRTRMKLRVERIVYFLLVIIFIAIYLYLKNNITEKYLKIFAWQGPLNIPIHELVFAILQGSFAFWYYAICFREIQGVLKKLN